MAAGSRKALVVEDDELNRKLLRVVLSREGFEVSTASSGEEGLEMARASLPDLILMDIRLPGMDGLAVTRLLKADGRTRSIPVVAVSAYAQEEHKASAAEAGCVEYITKPMDVGQLVAVARRLISPAVNRQEPKGGQAVSGV